LAGRIDGVISQVVGPRVLDVGCAAHLPRPGSPDWLHGRLRQRFPQVVGIDIHRENIEALRGIGYEEVHVGDAQSFSLAGRFDTIVAGELVEHLSNPGLFLRKAREHLRPGGRIVITTPYPFSLFFNLYSWVNFPRTCSNPEHTCWFCPQTIGELARRQGLCIARWFLVEDYSSEVTSRKYRLFAAFIRAFRGLLPRRLRCNTMIVVLEAAGRESPDRT
jgi:SAM-dependent methyltransferase